MNKWFNSKFYFAFWMFLAALPMKHAFNVSAEIDHESQKTIEGQQEQSSMAPVEDLYSYNESEGDLAGVSDEQLLETLTLSDAEYAQS